MAVTVAFTADAHGRQRVGKQKVYEGRLTLTGTYDTGGVAVVASNFGLTRLDSLRVNSAWEGAESYTAIWDSTNGKIKLGWSPAHTHTENTAATYTQNATTAASTAAVLSEIANTTDVSNVLLDITVKGA